ncbi:MAG: RNA 2'-phosphotransferase [Myxococcales bacterium]|nr:RNA 2'-phosphotransferase [Myxococcales bacterium]
MTLSRTSRRLAWLLRHGAIESDLAMDEAGWADLTAVCDAAGLERSIVLEVVERNDKKRFEVRGQRIRATQGHSLRGTPVTRTALEASWTQVADRRQPLFHGTRRHSLGTIAVQGLRAMERSHVHLADSPDARVGKRAGVDLLLEVDPARLAAAGLQLFVSPNGVWLTRRVPQSCICDVIGLRL